METRSSLIVLSQCPLRGSQIRIGLRQQAWVGGQIDRSLIFRDRFAHLVTGLKVSSKVASAHRIFGIDACRRLKMRMGLFLFALENKGAAKVVLCDEVVLSDSKCVRPQGDIALPVADLAVSNRGESN